MRIKVAVAGATGAVGQRFIQLLQNHPWFQLNEVLASESSKGKKLKDACKFSLFDMPEEAGNMIIKGLDEKIESRIVFSALPSDVAGDAEEGFVEQGAVVASNAGHHRMEKNVPLVIPEVNHEHLEIVRGKKAFIITNANCTTTQLVLALKPLHDTFGISKVSVVSMQALSGAGYPGVSSMDIADNVLPHIKGEEEKVEREPLKILGVLDTNGKGSGNEDGDGDVNRNGKRNENNADIIDADISISASCNRVNVTDGHLECVSVKLSRDAGIDEVKRALTNFSSIPQEMELPSAPLRSIIYSDDPDRPQPRLDRDKGKGMSVVVGRLKPDNVLDFRFHVQGHNTIRGAAGGSILNAELLYALGYLEN